MFDLAIDDVEGEVSKKLGEAAGKSIDLVTRAILRAGTNIIYGGTAAYATLVASLLTAQLLRKAAFTLKKNGGEPWVYGGKRRFPAITCAEAINDLMQDTAIAAAMQYGYGNNLADNEANLLDGGIAPELDVMGVRLFDTTQAASIYSSSAGWSYRHVYTTIVFAKDAYGVVEQDANSMKRYFIPANTPSKSDPLQQRWYMGWKAVHNAVILNNDNMVNILHKLGPDFGSDII